MPRPMTQADVDYAEALYIAQRSDDAITSSLVYRGLSREEACELLELVKLGTPPAISPRSRGRPFSANANCIQTSVAQAASSNSGSTASLFDRCVWCGLQFSTVLLWLAACTLGFTPGGCAKVQLDRMSHGVKICSASDCSRDAVGSLPYTPEWAARIGPLPYGSGRDYQVSVPFCSEHLKAPPKKIKESQSRKSTSGRLVVWSLVHLVYGFLALAAPIRYGSRSGGPEFFFKIVLLGILLVVIGLVHNRFTLDGVV